MKIIYCDSLNFDRKLVIEFDKKLDVVSSMAGVGFNLSFRAWTDSKRHVKKLIEFYSVDKIEFCDSGFDEESEKYFLETTEDYRFCIIGHIHFSKLLDFSKMIRSVSDDLSPIVRLSKK